MDLDFFFNFFMWGGDQYYDGYRNLVIYAIIKRQFVPQILRTLEVAGVPFALCSKKISGNNAVLITPEIALVHIN